MPALLPVLFSGVCLLASPALCGPAAADAPAPQEDAAWSPQAAGRTGPGPETGKRLGRLEKKVEKMDKRVTRLEKAAYLPAAPADFGAEPGPQPLTVALVKKKQVLEGEELGLNLVLEFRNMRNHGINGFSGTLVFKAESSSGVYTRKMAYAHPLGSGETAQIELKISSDETKQYLKFVKARLIRVALINQKLFE